MSIMRCPRCSNPWDSDYDDRDTELCRNCEERELQESCPHDGGWFGASDGGNYCLKCDKRLNP